MKNREILSAITSLQSLKGLQLDGDIALEVVKLKKKLSEKMDIIQEAEKNVIESFCSKDDQGKPKSEIKEQNGFQFMHYEFPNNEASESCSNELEKIRNTDFHITPSIVASRLNLIKCSPEQMEALMMLSF